MAEVTKTTMADVFLILVQMAIEINMLNSQNTLEHIENLMCQLIFSSSKISWKRNMF